MGSDDIQFRSEYQSNGISDKDSTELAEPVIPIMEMSDSDIAEEEENEENEENEEIGKKPF